jgi:hypothetical protein
MKTTELIDIIKRALPEKSIKVVDNIVFADNSSLIDLNYAQYLYDVGGEQEIVKTIIK